MPHSKLRSTVAACALLTLLAQVSSRAGEQPLLSFKASEVLPASLQKSPVHTVKESVGLNGVMYAFEVTSNFGIYKVNSTEMLQIRVHEFQVLKDASNISGMEQFGNSLKDSVVQVPVSAVKLVTEPVQSVKNIGTSVKSKFSRIGRFFSSGRKKSQYEDSSFRELTQGQKKREVAAELGLDVYSSNPKVQKLLNHLARSRAVGAAPVRLAGLAHPAVGISLTALRLRRDISDDLKNKTPSELNAMNDKVLKKLDVERPIRRAFLNHRRYSPKHKTTIVANLEAMKGVDGLGNFLMATLEDTTEEEALFSERQSDMLLFYHKRIEKLDRMGRAGHLPIAFTKKDNMILMGPADYVSWREQSEKMLAMIQSIAKEEEAKKKTIIITGRFGHYIKRHLKNGGIEVVERFMGGK